MQKRRLIVSLALATLVGQSQAQSLLETYEQALLNDTSLAIERLEAESAQQDVISGRSNVLPAVSFDGTYGVRSESRSSSDVGDWDETLALNFDAQNLGATITLSQNIFAIPALTAYSAVKVNASVAELEAEQAEQRLMVLVAEKYINALRAKDALDVTTAQLEAVERQFEQTQQRYEVGLVTITDVLDATATLDQTKVALIRAESQLDIALQDLSTLTGEIPATVFSLSENLPVEIPSKEGQQKWVDFAVANHPDVTIAERRLEAGELTLKAKKQNLLPLVAGTASVSYSDTFGSDAAAFENDFEQNWSASIGLRMSVDLYKGGANKADIIKQGLTNNIAEQGLEQLKRGIAVQVANLYRTVQADAQNVEAQAQALKSRESALQATTVGYDVGTRNIVEVLNAQLAVFNAQNALNNARYDYALNLLRLKEQAGQLARRDLEQIETYLVRD